MTSKISVPFHPADYSQGTAREWLVTNGLGGYASSTANGSNTRAYHGLLVAATKVPTGRRLLFSSLDEELGSISLASHQYPGAIYPEGFSHLAEFWTDPFPRFCYRLKKASLEKTVFMVRNENTTVVSYKIRGYRGLLRITPLIHNRSFHAASPFPPFIRTPGKMVPHSSPIPGSLSSLTLPVIFLKKRSTTTSNTKRNAFGAWAGRRTSSLLASLSSIYPKMWISPS